MCSGWSVPSRRGREIGANRLDAFDGAAQLQSLDPDRSLGSFSGGKDGPHVGPQGIDRALEVFQALRKHRRAGQAGIDLVQQRAKADQLLGERLVFHSELSVEVPAAADKGQATRFLRQTRYTGIPRATISRPRAENFRC